MGDRDEEEDYFEIMSDEELYAEKLKFGAFKSQKRNTGKSGHNSRSQTLDLSNSPKLQSMITVKDENNDIVKTLNHNKMFRKSIKSKRKRNRLSISGKSANGELSDVIEIKFRIDRTKKGYLFIGILPANKINAVVQPGFMFGFNEFSYSFHGYSGKIYHDKIQSEYYFAQNNKDKNEQNKTTQKEKKHHHHKRAQTVDITLSSPQNNEEKEVETKQNEEEKKEEKEEEEEEEKKQNEIKNKKKNN